MKKQFKYADDKHIPFVAIVGDEEMSNQVISLKNMLTGEQAQHTVEELIEKLLC